MGGIYFLDEMALDLRFKNEAIKANENLVAAVDRHNALVARHNALLREVEAREAEAEALRQEWSKSAAQANAALAADSGMLESITAVRNHLLSLPRSRLAMDPAQRRVLEAVIMSVPNRRYRETMKATGKFDPARSQYPDVREVHHHLGRSYYDEVVAKVDRGVDADEAMRDGLARHEAGRRDWERGPEQSPIENRVLKNGLEPVDMAAAGRTGP
mgnify:CR=1 FL=1